MTGPGTSDATLASRATDRILSRRSEACPASASRSSCSTSRTNPRARDRQDFERCLPRLDDDGRALLCRLLTLAYPGGHEWLERLSEEKR